VTIPQPGHAQTVLVIGSDHRAGQSFRAANTDTMMLVRLDPSSSTINVLSIPRDLQVDIPGEGTAKLNSAYSVGGPNLLIKVLHQQVFPNLAVNHIIDVNFGGFTDLVNAIGCVYTDVDHRYYNDTRVTDYSSIDLQPGYQRLCGTDALSFVRFRHTDNDLVRNARQQDFIRWAKDQYGVDQIITNRDHLLRIFGGNTQTDADLHSVDGLINLFNLVAFSAGHTIKQIRFPAIVNPCGGGPVGGFGPAVAPAPCYVSADHAAEGQAFSALMRPTVASAVPARQTASGPQRGGPAPARSPAPSGLTGDFADGQAQASAMRGLPMTVYAPTAIAAGSSYCSTQTSTCPVQVPSPHSYPRAYRIHDQTGHGYAAYRMTLVVNPLLGQYYGVQGTTWKSPPILAGAHDTQVVNGHQLLLYYNGHKLTVVAWRTPHEVVWISNTLTDDLSDGQMIGIAASLTRA
jgi:polyisoprenyl-teichoic acid--peptidoglycan teichoic acid transferase